MITYYLVMPFLYLLAYLPTGVLYVLSDVLAFVLRNIIRYRHKVVMANLRNSFPEKSEQELQGIAKRFYTHLADRVIENIKCITLEDDELKRRCSFDPASKAMLLKLYEEKRDVVIMVAHTGAWEWGGYMANRDTPYKTYGVYSPVKNPYFNRMVIKTRGKMGMKLVSMRETSAYFKTQLSEQTLHIFFTDQSPSNPNNAYWTNFMHQDTAFFYGGARYALKHNAVPVYAWVREESRGHFTIYLTMIKHDLSNTTADEIVQGFADLLAQQLHAMPADWLWSHKRWKRQKPVN